MSRIHPEDNYRPEFSADCAACMRGAEHNERHHEHEIARGRGKPSRCECLECRKFAARKPRAS